MVVIVTRVQRLFNPLYQIPNYRGKRSKTSLPNISGTRMIVIESKVGKDAAEMDESKTAGLPVKSLPDKKIKGRMKALKAFADKLDVETRNQRLDEEYKQYNERRTAQQTNYSRIQKGVGRKCAKAGKICKKGANMPKRGAGISWTDTLSQLNTLANNTSSLLYKQHDVYKTTQQGDGVKKIVASDPVIGGSMVKKKRANKDPAARLRKKLLSSNK